MKKEVIKEIINKHLDDNEIAVKIFEEIDDYTDPEGETDFINEYETKYNELLQKYRDRFLNGEKIEVKEDIEDISEKEVVDISEI